MAYIGNSPGVASQRVVTNITATAGQTVFTPISGYTLGYVEVYQNGLLLVSGTDYTADDGQDITFSQGANLDDDIQIVAYQPRGLTDGYTKAEADARYEPLDSAYTKAESDSRYATSAQGSTADSAVQPGDLSTVATSGAYADLSGKPTNVSSFTNDSGYATTSYVDTAESDAVATANAYTDTAVGNVTTDLVGDTTPQLGGNLDTNGNDITFGDNDKATFGAGSDLQIYHDGTNSQIRDLGTGDLYIQASAAVRLTNTNASETYAVLNENGAVSLYYDNSGKLATTSTGVDVTGTVTADGLSLPDGAFLYLGDGNDFLIRHDGTNTIMRELGAGGFFIDGENITFRNSNGTETYAEMLVNGAVQLRHDNNAKLTTTSTGIDVTGAITVNGSPLEAGAKDGIFWENGTTITSNYTITSGKNAGTFGPVEIADGVTVTIPTGSTWTVV